MKVKDLKGNYPYIVYLSSLNKKVYTSDIDMNKYLDCRCEIFEWEDDDGADENGCTIIRKGADLIIYDK